MREGTLPLPGINSLEWVIIKYALLGAGRMPLGKFIISMSMVVYTEMDGTLLNKHWHIHHKDKKMVETRHSIQFVLATGRLLHSAEKVAYIQHLICLLSAATSIGLDDIGE
jgi:hypothetical protein